MSMNPVTRNDKNTPEELIKEFLNNGGEIQTLPQGKRSDTVGYKGGFWNRKKTPKKDDK